MSSFLVQLQQQCADRLQADPLFANVPVLTERLANFQSELERALGPLNARAGRTGLALIVRTPIANVNFENVFGPFFDEIRITVRVLENVPVNQDPSSGTGISAAEAAERICALLHHCQLDGARGPVVAQKPAINLANDPNYLAYDCRFRASGGISATIPQLDQPTAVLASGHYSISTGTPGAAIFYTLDGGNPSPRNGTLYSAPVAVAPGQNLRARAWLAGYLASDTLSVSG